MTVRKFADIREKLAEKAQRLTQLGDLALSLFVVDQLIAEAERAARYDIASWLATQKDTLMQEALPEVMATPETLQDFFPRIEIK